MRLKKKNWLDLGLERLAADGPDALTVDGLCAAAGRTKGSFYHHFESREDFVAALLAHWSKSHTEDVIDKVEKDTGGTARRRALDTLSARLDDRIERQMRRWAGSDAAVAAAIAANDGRRIAYLEKLIGEAGELSKDGEAADLAILEYATFLGLMELGKRIDGPRRLRLRALIDRIAEARLAPPGD